MRIINAITFSDGVPSWVNSALSVSSNASVAPEEAKILQQRAAFAVPLQGKMTDYRANGMLMPVINGIFEFGRRVFASSKAN